MAPFANPAQLRRQYYDSEDLDNTTSLPEPVETSALAAAPENTEAPPPVSKGPSFPMTAPAIVGIVSAVLLLFGICLLLWRRRARAKEIGRLRKFEISVEKYGVGHGVANPIPVRNSIEKVDLPRSFFDTDDDEDARAPRKSKLNFRLSSKATPKSPVTPRSPKSMHQFFVESTPDPMPPMQHVPAPLQTKPAAPLRVINGAPEPWTPATPSIMVPSARSTRLIETPQLPPLAAFPAKRSLDVPSMPPPRRSSLADPPVLGQPTSSRQAPSAPGPSPNSSPASARKPRKLPTPPHPPPTLLNYPSNYNQEQDPSRPGSANSQNRPGLARLMTAVTRFTPTLNDELALQVGDTVRMIDEYKDGWCLVQQVGRMDSPRGVVPAVCLQERKWIVPVPGSANGSFTGTGFPVHR
ncbi:hypothetical protein BKA70DRAFT_1306366 [Coprinopsis sp. MPI-PUGE-AT-0042]|nr:hypothetical protein BKA70DRAFT_1306366 [Coprinopsis sp. MPI-PUGE-AT-0042]